jgi:hypothetical protein
MIHAKTAGCLPLYWADNNCHKDFNPRSFLNLYDFDSLDSFIEKIIYLDENNFEYTKIVSEYLFTDREPTLNNIKIQLRNIL